MLAPSSSGTRACPAVLTIRPGSQFAGDAAGCLGSRSDPVVAPGHDCAVRTPRPHPHTHVHCPRALRRRRRGLARRKLPAPPPTRGWRCDGWLLTGARCLEAGVARKASGGFRRQGGPDPQAHSTGSTSPTGRGYAPGRLRATARQSGRRSSGHHQGRAVGTAGAVRAVDPARAADPHDRPRAASAHPSAGDTPFPERSEGDGEDRISREVGHFRGA